MEKNKTVTIEQLAEMSQRQFAVVDKRLDNIDQRLGDVEDKMVTKDVFKEGIEMIMEKIDGLHDEVKSGQLAS